MRSILLCFISITLVALWLTNAVQCVQSVTRTVDPNSQYPRNDTDITYIDNKNATQFRRSDTKASLVEFYKSWCGYCRRFKSVFTAFSRSLSRWKPILQIGAVDCADVLEGEIDACKKHEVRFVPRVRFFPPGLNNTENFHGLHIEANYETFQPMRDELIDMMVGIYKNKSAPKDWPSLEPVSVKGFDDLWNKLGQDLPKPNGKMLLILEGPSTNLTKYSAEIIFELSGFKFKTKRISPSIPKVYEDLKIKRSPNSTHPYFIKLTADKNFISFIGDQEAKTLNVSQALERVFKTMNVSDSNSKVDHLHHGEEKPIKQDLLKNVYYDDLFKTLHDSLMLEVPDAKFDKTKLEALKAYLEVVDMHFPFGGNQKAHDFVKKVRQEIGNMTDLDATQYGKILDKYDRKSLPVVEKWVQCKNFNSQYSCGLWVTFHTMVTDEYRQTRKSTANHDHKALRSMRNYVKNFFTCIGCAKNFEKSAVELDNALVAQNSSMLWMWNKHNKVNNRLTLEEPRFPKEQYPTVELCPHCRQPDGTFNVAKTMDFLEAHYNPSNMISNSKLIQNNTPQVTTVSPSPSTTAKKV